MLSKLHKRIHYIDHSDDSEKLEVSFINKGNNFLKLCSFDFSTNSIDVEYIGKFNIPDGSTHFYADTYVSFFMIVNKNIYSIYDFELNTWEHFSKGTFYCKGVEIEKIKNGFRYKETCVTKIFNEFSSIQEFGSLSMDQLILLECIHGIDILRNAYEYDEFVSLFPEYLQSFVHSKSINDFLKKVLL